LLVLHEVHSSETYIWSQVEESSFTVGKFRSIDSIRAVLLRPLPDSKAKYEIECNEKHMRQD
jgi:hypothetical protein